MYVYALLLRLNDYNINKQMEDFDHAGEKQVHFHNVLKVLYFHALLLYLIGYNKNKTKLKII